MYEINCTIREQHGEYYYNFEAWSVTHTSKSRLLSSVGHLKGLPVTSCDESLEIVTVLSRICQRIAQGIDVELF